MHLDDRYEDGDDVTLRVRVEPEGGVPTDGTTVAIVRATPPDGGIPISPTALPNDDRSIWQATLPGVSEGEWVIEWTVTGTGSGIRSYVLSVAPNADQPGVPPSRSYASTADLANYLDDQPPERARTLLRRASRKVDELLRCAIYDVDTDGYPTDAGVAAALRDATCAQVEWWSETGDEAGTGSVAALAGAQIGTVRLPGGSGSGGSASLEFAPDAQSFLAAAGLSNQGPIIPGRYGYLR